MPTSDFEMTSFNVKFSGSHFHAIWETNECLPLLESQSSGYALLSLLCDGFTVHPGLAGRTLGNACR